MAERVVIRSYRRVFEVDRRIYRVDRWALPVPGRRAAAGGRLLRRHGAAAAGAGGVPGVGELVGMLSPPLRYVVLPLAVAVLGHAGGAGRAHGASLRVRLAAAAGAGAAAVRGPRGRARGRAGALGRLSWRCAGTPTRPQLQRGRVRGPARVTFNVPVELHGLRARPAADGQRGDAVVLCAGAVLEVRP